MYNIDMPLRMTTLKSENRILKTKESLPGFMLNLYDRCGESVGDMTTISPNCRIATLTGDVLFKDIIRIEQSSRQQNRILNTI